MKLNFEAGWKAPGASKNAKESFARKDLSQKMNYFGRKSEEYRALKKVGNRLLVEDKVPRKTILLLQEEDKEQLDRKTPFSKRTKIEYNDENHIYIINRFIIFMCNCF